MIRAGNIMIKVIVITVTRDCARFARSASAATVSEL